MVPLGTPQLRLAVVSPHPDAKAEAAFGKLADWMRANAGVELTRVEARSYGELTLKVRGGECDLAWLPPVVYAWLAEAVTPIGCIARGGATTYGSALVVDESSDITKLDDLRGKKVGWVDRWSASGYVVPRLELAKKGLDPTTLFGRETFYGTPADTLRALVRGECDVAATFANAASEGNVEGLWTKLPDAKVRVVALLGSIPSDVIAARRNLGTADYEAVVAAFRKASAEAGELLGKVWGGTELRDVEPGHEELRRAYESGLAKGLFD